MTAGSLFNVAWQAICTDRTVHAGATTSGLSLWGARTMATISEAQAWVALFAAVFGGLSALATFVYVCIKIRRLLRTPNAVE